MPVSVPEPEVRAPKVGVRPRGSVCDRARTKLARLTVEAAEGADETARGAWQAFRARTYEVHRWLQQLGPAGEEAGRQVWRVSDDAEIARGKLMVGLERLRSQKIKSADEQAAMRALYRGDDGSELTGGARAAYDEMASRFEMILRTAKLLEVQRAHVNPDGTVTYRPIEGAGNPYPTIPNAEGREILKDAAKGRRNTRVIDAAFVYVENNVPQVKQLFRDLNAAERRHAHQVALGHVPDGISDAARAAGEALAEHAEKGFSALAKYHDDAMRGTVPYLERERIQLPEHMIEFDPHKALPHFFRRQALMLAAFREWGNDMGGFASTIERIAAENGAGTKARLKDYVSTQLGVPIADTPNQVVRDGKPVAVRTEKQILQGVRDLTMLRIFGGTVLGPLRNLGGSFTNATDMPVSAWVRSIKELPPFLHRFVKSAQALREMIVESGSITGESALTDFGGTLVGRNARKAAVIHNLSIEESEFRSAAIGYLGAQENIRRLLQMQGEKGPIAKALLGLRHLSSDPGGAVERALQRSGIPAERIQQIKERAANATPQELKALIDKPTDALSYDEWMTAMRRASHDTQFGYTFANRHVFSGQDDTWSMIYMLKNWGVRQIGYVRDYVISELGKGNAKPLVKLLGTTFLVGELYNIGRDMVTGSEHSMLSQERNKGDVDIGASIIRNIREGGAIGILADVMWGWGNLVFGPIGSTVADATEMAAHSLAMPSQTPTAVKEFVQNQLVVSRQARGVWERLTAETEAKHDRFFATRRWRDRGFDFVSDQENPTLPEKAQENAIQWVAGLQRFRPTERSLTYDQVSAHITGGNVDDAADYVRRLLATAKTADERASILKGLETAKRHRSPLGPVPVRDRAAFLAQFSPAERSEARRLQAEWERDWERAVQLGKRPQR